MHIGEPCDVKTMNSDLLKLPIDTEESASLGKIDNLLPQSLYEKLSDLIKETLDKTTQHSNGDQLFRSHHSILVDGDRGTGKTSVLVNLDTYLKVHSESVAEDVLVLNPIDPTLLDDGDSLFLTIIVASVLSDSSIKKRQEAEPEKAIVLNRALDKLATALESAEVDSTAIGMRKIRNMYDNNSIAGCVHDFFGAVLSLMGKKLLVLPIDDVDTSLSRAFENLEIIRRYLTSPKVQPIIGGDLSLYQEVIWRDFHYRLTKDSNFRADQAYDQALNLATEYQRKVMPLSRRLTMPNVSSYLDNSNIMLVKQDKDLMSLANFYAWLEIFLAGPVNGLEDSSLPIPIKSVRALTQLLNKCQDLIPCLPEELSKAETPLPAKQYWQMPCVDSSLFDDFYKDYYLQSREATDKRRYGAVFIDFATKLKSKEESKPHKDAVIPPKELLREWELTLQSHFMHEEDAGALNLVLQARKDWSNVDNTSVLKSPIFQPLLHGQREWARFSHASNLDDWQAELKEKLPMGWLQKHKGRETILPYPLPQVGFSTSLSWQKSQSYKDEKETLLTLLTNYNFYTDSKQTRMINSGRIFEILIHSLVAPLDFLSIQGIANRAPFYSTSDLAPTKALSISDEGNVDEFFEHSSDDFEIDGLGKLADEIAKWRERHNLEEFRLSPWLVYKAFNKVFSQLTHFEPSKSKSTDKYLQASLDLLAFTFNATWAAFASFEKGQLFGLPVTVATTNISSDSNLNFEANPHFRSNISPFTPRLGPLLDVLAQGQSEGPIPEPKARHIYGGCTRTVTHVLADHPLRLWINHLLEQQKIETETETAAETATETSLPIRYLKYLKERFDISLPPGLDVEVYMAFMDTLEDGLARCEQIITDTPDQYKNSGNYKVLSEACKQLRASREQ